jgi:hypothetical protein
MGRYDALTTLDEAPKETPKPAAASPAPDKPPASRNNKKRRDENKPLPLPQKVIDTTKPLPDQEIQDTSLLTTKEKTKYGTYLTDESIEKIRIRAIQMKRDDHQIVQEAVNQYFEKLGK